MIFYLFFFFNLPEKLNHKRKKDKTFRKGEEQKLKKAGR